MKISSIYEKKERVLAFEIFPPKKTDPVDTIYSTLDELKELKPDYISVTFGAGGSGVDNKTCKIASDIKYKYGIESVAHLTCRNYSYDEIKEMLVSFKDNGIENILALRGDVNPDIEPKDDFRFASELVEFIKKNGDFFISGACYPEVHSDAHSAEVDLDNLKRKVDAGAQLLVSQLFFDNELFYDFAYRANKKGINVPIEAGIMPVISKTRIEKMVTMCGASIPHDLVKILQKYEYSPDDLKKAGIDYATNQIIDLLNNGVRGIHLYTMNNAQIAKKITDNISYLL